MSSTRKTRSSEESEADELRQRNEGLQSEVEEMSAKMEELKKTIQQMLLDNVQASMNAPVSPPLKTKMKGSGEHEQAMKIAELMQETARLAASSTPLERSTVSRGLTNSSQAKWLKFLGFYRPYKENGGIKKLFDLMEDDARLSYTVLLDFDDVRSMRVCDEQTLFRMIERYHECASTGLAILKDKLKMEKSSIYNKEKIQVYIQDFLVLLERHHNIRDELEEEVIVSIFFPIFNPLI